MTTSDPQELNWHSVGGEHAETPYERAVTGFKNYWYPACGVRDIGRLPLRRVLLGEPVAFVKRGASVFALQDECPHRGARLSLGKDEFPGTETLSCRFHGWTFDLNTGRCVAALTDGPDSPVVGKVRVRTFPVQARKGIVWIWMGRGDPVALEEDVPKLLLRDDTNVKYRYRIVTGNWRYHAEGSAGGHFQMLHRDAFALLTTKFFAYAPDYAPATGRDETIDDGEYLFELNSPPVWQADYPGLGSWPPTRPWRGLNRRRGGSRRVAHHGVRQMGIRLPGFLRVPNFPMLGAIYYEWYVAIDANHYLYFQVSAHWPRNPVSRLWTHLWYHLWAGPMRKGRFNNQDKAMILAQSVYHQRHGGNRPTPLYRPDRFPRAWVDYCNEHARGEVSPTVGTEQVTVVPVAGGGPID